MERTSCLGVWGTEKGGALDLWFCSKSRVAGRSRFRDHVGVEDVQWGCGGCSLVYSRVARWCANMGGLRQLVVSRCYGRSRCAPEKEKEKRVDEETLSQLGWSCSVVEV